MYSVLSDSRVFDILLTEWPIFAGFVSFDQLLRNGWVNNVFFSKNIPYVWRSNMRIGENRFWEIFVNVFSDEDESDGFVLFHEKHAGWKKNGAVEKYLNGICLQGLSDVSVFMRKFAFYSRRHWRYGARNDNYNLLFIHSKIFVSFTHEGEFLCFSNDKIKLTAIVRFFRALHLSCKFELC